jgi:predicted nucleotidyltransferase component of viral defense system
MVTFFESATTSGCQRGLGLLERERFIANYYLAGGTALALQIGHRISTDLDWFSTSGHLLTQEREEIRRALAAAGDFEIASEQDGALFGRLFGTDVSFIHQPHPLLEPTVSYQGVKLASPTDIGLMKLAAINARGTRRDFVDLYCLRAIVSLEQLLALAPTKYHDRPSFLAIAVRALAYFEDAEAQPMPRLLTDVQWSDVRTYCESAARHLARRLSGI